MDDIKPDMGTREQYMKNGAVMIRLQGHERTGKTDEERVFVTWRERLAIL